MRQSHVLEAPSEEAAELAFLEQASFEGPEGADFIEVVAQTDSPLSLYAHATRPFNTCSATATARIGPDTVVIRRSTHTASLSIYMITEKAPIPGTTEKIIQFLAFARLGHSVLYVLVATPERLEPLGGLIAEALHDADPSLLPKHTFTFG